jgi:hypothetical protein
VTRAEAIGLLAADDAGRLQQTLTDQIISRALNRFGRIAPWSTGETGMGTQENKAVVRRFGDMLTTGRINDPDLIDELVDELLAPNYVNLAMGDADLAGFKAMVPAMASVMKDVRIDDLELVAEGDAVFARFNYSFTLPDGSTTTSRTMAYHRLADGKIVVNDVMSVPDMPQVLGPYLAPSPGAQS